MQRIISAQEKNEDRGAWAERNCKLLGVEQTDWIKMKKNYNIEEEEVTRRTMIVENWMER